MNDDLPAVAVWLATAVLLPDVGLLHHLPALQPCLLTGAHVWVGFISYKSIHCLYLSICYLSDEGILEHIHRW